MSQIFRLFFGLTATFAVFFSSQALADPSGRVGRISLLDGPSLLRVDREDSGSQATLNWPISSGAILDTESGSRAEIWVGSTAFRLVDESRLEFGLVDDRQMNVNLAAGTLAVTIRDRDQADDLEVRTPHGRVKFGTAGSYRIDVGTLYTNVSTAYGKAYVYKGERPINVSPGQTVSIDLNGAVASYGDARRDSFDDWTQSRDAATQSRTSSRYVSPEMTGYQDLEHYGEWSSMPEYGSIWYPRAVPAGWAPYRDGRWAWVAPWGWTWVDAAPWGFAPFHYGRWLEVRGRWAWAPGNYVARPVYAPALVAWVGNPGWNVRFSTGSVPSVGWFPLAPREVYVPSYRASNNYVRQVNVTHVSNVTVVERAISGHGDRHFAHRDSTRAVTVVPANALRESRHIAGANLPNRGQHELRQAPVSAQAPSTNWVAPNATSAPNRSFAPPGVRHDVREPVPLRTTNDAIRNSPEQRGERSPLREQSRTEPLQRPLPEGINRLPPDRRSLETPVPVAAPAPASQPMRAPAPLPSVSPTLPPPERRQPEPRPASVELKNSPPSPERMPERHRERAPANVTEPAPQVRSAVASPQPAPPITDRPRHEARQAPVDTRPTPTTMERMPMERRIERPAPVINEPARQREMAPPSQPQRSPSPAAAPLPVRETPQQTERRPPAPEQRPANAPREERGRHGERENRPGPQ